MSLARVRFPALVLAGLLLCGSAAGRTPRAAPLARPGNSARVDQRNLARALHQLQRSRQVFERTEARLCELPLTRRGPIRALTVAQRAARARGNLARAEICRTLLKQSLKQGNTALATNVLFPALQRSLERANLDLGKAAALQKTRRQPGRDMALGIDGTADRPGMLERFADRVVAYDYPDWLAAGLIDKHRDVSLERFRPAFQEALNNVVQRGGTIHVNLTGINPGRLLRDREGATAHELRTVLGDPRYLQRVQFHLDGKPLTQAQVLGHPRLGQLGRLMRGRSPPGQYSR